MASVLSPYSSQLAILFKHSSTLRWQCYGSEFGIALLKVEEGEAETLY
jgi:hypothetical protein